MVGKKLDLGFWAIDGEEQAMQTSLHVIRNYNIDVADLIVSSIASATLVAGPDLRKAGTLVIDLELELPISFSIGMGSWLRAVSFQSVAIILLVT